MEGVKVLSTLALTSRLVCVWAQNSCRILGFSIILVNSAYACRLYVYFIKHPHIFQAIGAVCRQAGHRFGDHVEKVVPMVLKYAQVEDDELREHCLQVCENMVYKCGKEISPHIPVITNLCLKYICYDPNYNYDEMEDDDSMDCDQDEDDESAEEYSGKFLKQLDRAQLF